MDFGLKDVFKNDLVLNFWITADYGNGSVWKIKMDDDDDVCSLIHDDTLIKYYVFVVWSCKM